MAGKGSAPGERRGGRAKGTKNKKNAALVAAVEASGATPLEVMLENMRLAHGKGKAILQELIDGGAEVPEGFDKLVAMQRFYSMAQDAAKDAAPYVHAKLASVEVGNKPGETFKVILGSSDNGIL